MLITTDGSAGTPLNAPALRLVDRTIVGWADDSGQTWATEVADSGTITTVPVGKVGSNRHMNATFAVLMDGKILAVYGNHSTSTRMRISSSIGTVADGFGAEIALPTIDMRYPTPIITNEGAGGEGIYVFHAHSVSGRDGRYIYSDDRGQSWSGTTILFESPGNDWVYITARKSQATGRILVGLTNSNPDNGSALSDGYLMIYDPSTGAWRSAAGDTLSLPMTTDPSIRIYSAAEHGGLNASFTICAYENVGGQIYAVFRATHRTNSTSQLFRVVWSGIEWVVQPVFDDLALVKRNNPIMTDGLFDELFVGVANGDGWFDMVRATTNDGGASWATEQITNGEIVPNDPAHTSFSPFEVRESGVGQPRWAVNVWRYFSQTTFGGSVYIEDVAVLPDTPATFRAAPSEPLTFYAAGALNDEPEAPSAAPTVTLTPASQTALSLSLSEVDGATGYRYRVGTSGSWTDLGSSRTAQITGLSPGTSYTVQARAYNAAGDGPIGSATASTQALEVNAPPVFQTSPPTSVRAGQTYVYNGVVTDADGDPITITLEEGPDWLELTDHGDGTFTLEGTAPGDEN